MVIFIILVAAVPFLLGVYADKLKKEKSVSLLEPYMTGLLLLFAISEAAACAAIKWNNSFHSYMILLGACTGIACLLSLLICKKQVAGLLTVMKQGILRLREIRLCDKRQKRLAVLFAGAVFLFFLQLTVFFIYVPAVGGDITAETIHATRMSGTIFQYHPLTGLLMEQGIYPKYKLATLPILYSAFIQAGGAGVERFLFLGTPVWVLIVNYALMWSWGGLFWKGRKDKKYTFLIFYGLLNLMGDYSRHTFSYGLLHGSWKGTALLTAWLLPFAGYCIYRMTQHKEKIWGAAGLLLSAIAAVSAVPLFFDVKSVFASITGGKHWGVFILALLALYVMGGKEKGKSLARQKWFLAAAFLGSFFAGSPFTTIAISYLGVEIGGIAEEKRRGLPAFLGMLLLICATGTVFPYRADVVKRKYVAESEQDVRGEIERLMEEMEDVPVLLAPDVVMEHMRISNENVRLYYGKDLWIEDCGREVADVYTKEQLQLFDMMKKDYENCDKIAELAAETDCSILVLREYMSDEAARRFGWLQTEKVTGYAVYYRR